MRLFHSPVLGQVTQVVPMVSTGVPTLTTRRGRSVLITRMAEENYKKFSK